MTNTLNSDCPRNPSIRHRALASRSAMGAAVAFLFALGACSDQQGSPTAPALSPSAAAAAKAPTGSLLTHVPVTGVLSATATGTFTGVLCVTHLAVNDAGQLLVSGTVANAAPGVVTTFTDVAATLTGGSGGTCRILELDIGAIHLDLLGLVVDLAPIHLDITAQRGPGNLLGNLLCALVGLLDRGGPLATITGVLNQINAILAGLGA